MNKAIYAVAAIAALTGCANANLVGMRGDSLNTNYSLQDRRQAKIHVKVTQELPAGTAVMGDFKAERCHQYAQDNAPTEATLTDDLILLAYAEGADGITNIRFNKESGLLKNCWYIARGTATFYRDAKSASK